GGEGEADLGKPLHECDLQRDVDGRRKQRGLDRGQGVTAGKKRRGEAPEHDKGQETNGIRGEGRAGGRWVGRGKGAASKQRGKDRSGMAIEAAAQGTVSRSANWMP